MRDSQNTFFPAIYLRILSIVQELLEKDATCGISEKAKLVATRILTKHSISGTKRDLFYKDVALFGRQSVSDKVPSPFGRRTNALE